MEEIGIPELTSEQIESLCMMAEEAARKEVYSKVQKRQIERLIISSKIEGTKPVNLEVDVDIVPAKALLGINVQALACDAVKEAFRAARKYLEELKCPSQK